MSTFPPPPSMQPGGYPLPPRNPRSGRMNTKAKSAAPKPSGSRHKAPAKGKKRPLFTGFQWTMLFLLLCGVVIAIVSASMADNAMKKLLSDRADAEKAYQQEIARHKMIYVDDIRYYAAVNELDPAFVAAIIKRESDYDPYAVSNKGARGLMQFMPDSFDWVAPKFGISSDNFDAIYHPETAIKLGCYLLKYISDKYDGDPILIACAYHAGWGNVNSWLQKYSSDGKTLTLDQIPMEDTRYYARKVLEAYAIYQQHLY